LGTQVLAFNSTTATAAAALPSFSTAVRLYSDQNVFIEFEGTATKTTCMYLPAGIVEYFPVHIAGTTGMVISALGGTQSGNLYITPLSE
jgi:hypothetical protein